MQSIIKIKDLVGVEQLAAQTIPTANIDFSGWTHVLNGTVVGITGLTITGGSGTGLTITFVQVQGTDGDATNITIGDGGAGYAVGDVISIVQDSGLNWTGPISFTLTEAMFDAAQNSIVTPANGHLFGVLLSDPAGGGVYEDLKIGVMQNNAGIGVPLYKLVLSGATDLAKYNRLITTIDKAIVKTAQQPGITVDIVTEAGVSITEIVYESAGGGKIPKSGYGL